MSKTGIAAACAAAICWALPALGQDEETSPNVIQGGFKFSDPESQFPEDGAGIEAFLVSDDNAVPTGGRLRNVVVDQTRISPAVFDKNGTQVPLRICVDVDWALRASETIKRSKDVVRVKQKKDIEIEFVFFDCTIAEGIDNDDQPFDFPGTPICVLSQSEAVPIEDCKGFAKADISESASPFGKTELACKDGIDANDPAFDLDSDELFAAENAFPELIDGLEIKFKDRAAVEVPDEEFGPLVDPGLGLDPCPELPEEE